MEDRKACVRIYGQDYTISGERDRNREFKKSAVEILINRIMLSRRNRENRISVSSDEHEACLSEGEKSRKAVQ